MSWDRVVTVGEVTEPVKMERVRGWGWRHRWHWQVRVIEGRRSSDGWPMPDGFVCGYSPTMAVARDDARAALADYHRPL